MTARKRSSDGALATLAGSATGIAPMSGDLEGTDADGTPFGLLMWGQAGIFNGVDDRMVIAALAGSAVGVVREARITAGTGMTVNVGAGWLAIASCEDGTSCVVGSRQSHALTLPAGVPGTASVYHVWVDTHPDDARWELRAVPQGETIGRPGVSLGRVTVPAGASLASGAQFSGWVPTLGRHSDVPVTGHGRAVNQSWTRLTPRYLIAPYQIAGSRQFVLRANGTAHTGNSLRDPALGPASVAWPSWRGGGGQPPGGAGANAPSWTATPSLTLDPRGVVARGERFDWEAELAYQLRADLGGMRTKLTVTITRIGPYAGTWQGNVTAASPRSLTGTRSQTAQLWNRDWQEMFLEAAWNGPAAGQGIDCSASTMETYEPWAVTQ